MQTQFSMNIKQTIIRRGRALGLLLTMLFAYASVNAQCFITSSGPPCVGEPITFLCNTVGASNFLWDFNGQGSNNIQCDPSFIFTTSGVKTITLSLKLANGNTCNSSFVIEVFEKPVINVQRIVNKTQCF